MVDSSGSIGRRNWLLMKNFVIDVQSLFTIGENTTHIAVVAYSSFAEVVFNFNALQGSQITSEGYGKLISAMRWQRGYTYIDRGISKADEEVFTAQAGMRDDVEKVRICHIYFALHD